MLAAAALAAQLGTAAARDCRPAQFYVHRLQDGGNTICNAITHNLWRGMSILIEDSNLINATTTFITALMQSLKAQCQLPPQSTHRTHLNGCCDVSDIIIISSIEWRERKEDAALRVLLILLCVSNRRC